MKLTTSKSSKNPCIGIIGGVGPQATAYLYSELIKSAEITHKAEKNNQYPRIVVVSEPVTDFICDTDNLSEAKAQVLSAAHRLVQAGASTISIASNTVHLLYPEVEKICKRNKVKPISLIESVVAKCSQENYHSVGLLASPVTLKEQLYYSELEKLGIELIVPDESDFSLLGSIINSVIAGKVNQDQLTKYNNLVSKIASRVDAIILGCTELPLITQLRPGKPVINSTKVLAGVLIQHYYQQLAGKKS